MPGIVYTATYSPDDNKLRLYASSRLDPETYARVKAAGFGWAPKQELFVAPMWTPEREDLLLELAGEIGDEDTSLVDRAEQRAERFDDYSEKRGREAEGARRAVAAIADNIPLGQPILVGHHSEKRARKDAERIENGMRRAVDLWKTSKYWLSRARGAIDHARYKERPDVRARRIKVIEAAERKAKKSLSRANFMIRLWRKIDDASAWKKKSDGSEGTLLERAIYVANGDGGYELWKGLTSGTMTPQEAQAKAIAAHEAAIPRFERWIAHYEHRLEYERAMLAESGYQPPPKRPTKSELPLLNYGGTVSYRNPYHHGETATTEAVGITKAEWASIDNDYKGTRVSACGTHRVRVSMHVPGQPRHTLTIVYLTDSKKHEKPGADVVAVRAQIEEERLEATLEEKTERLQRQLAARAAAPPPPAEDAEFRALGEQLRAGVQVVSAPQLFPTPPELAKRMVGLAGMLVGQRVLEPSAGTGNLVEAIAQASGGFDCFRLVTVEVNSRLCEVLRQRRQKWLYANEHSWAIHCADFLGCNGDLGTFDVVIMNPPFENGIDVKHIEHALSFLKPGGRLVALCANGPRQRDALLMRAEHWENLPAGSFKEAGTNVNVALLVMRRGNLGA